MGSGSHSFLAGVDRRGGILAGDMYAGVEAGDGILDDFRGRPLLALSMLLGIGLGVASLCLSAVAIFKKHERLQLASIAFLVGLFLAILLLGELVVQH